MNKNNILSREYKINEDVLKKSTASNNNIYSSYFNLNKKESPSLSFNVKNDKNK